MQPTARAEINRENATHSTGAKTEEGKQRSKFNARRHNLTGQTIIGTEEEMAIYSAKCEALRADLRPEGELERSLVQSLADSQFQLDRARAIETNLFFELSIQHLPPAPYSPAPDSPTRQGGDTQHPTYNPARQGGDTQHPTHNPARQGGDTQHPTHNPARQRGDTQHPTHNPARQGGDTQHPTHNPARQGGDTQHPTHNPARQGGDTQHPTHNPARQGGDSQHPTHSPARQGGDSQYPDHNDPALDWARAQAIAFLENGKHFDLIGRYANRFHRQVIQLQTTLFKVQKERRAYDQRRNEQRKHRQAEALAQHQNQSVSRTHHSPKCGSTGHPACDTKTPTGFVSHNPKSGLNPDRQGGDRITKTLGEIALANLKNQAA